MPTHNAIDWEFIVKSYNHTFKECELIATWSEGLGLYCPGCKSTKLSIFEWDGESEYPE